jgi:hypothetical protein
MTKYAYLAATIAVISMAASSGCVCLDQCMGLRCGNNCYDCGSGGCDSCNSCGSCGSSHSCGSYGGGCSSCGSCNSCSSGGHVSHSCGSCNSCGSCGSGSCGCDSCSSCGGGCDSGCGCDMHKLFWPFNCNLLSDLENCCKGGETFDCPGGGCGEKYWCDWKSCPPTPDPCDKCGCYSGGCQCAKPCYQASPRFGSVPMWPAWPPHDDGSSEGGDDYVGQKTKATSTH